MKQNIDFRPYLNSLINKAFLDSASRGRRHSIIEDDDYAFALVLKPFRLNIEKLRLSKSLRRLEDKTQVFINRDNNHIRNRMSHTNEVASLAVLAGSILGLNIELAEAIALGHDIGHAPFGHLGERVISELSGKTFRHEIMSVVVAQKVERSGFGLNLSWEVLEGILYHSRGKNGLNVNTDLPLEYALVMFADKIAYTFSDLNDALRCGQFKESDLPSEFSALGKNQRERWLNCLFALIKESSEKGAISFQESETAQKFEALRQWSYTNFYPKLDGGGIRHQAREDLGAIYQFLENCLSTRLGYDPLLYDPFLIMALLTDREAKKIAAFAKFPTIGDAKMLKSFSFMELLSRFPEGHKVDIFDADLKVEDFS